MQPLRVIFGAEAMSPARRGLKCAGYSIASFSENLEAIYLKPFESQYWLFTVFRIHLGMSRAARLQQSVAWLELVRGWIVHGSQHCMTHLPECLSTPVSLNTKAVSSLHCS
jgi:hypothetical protein